MTTPAERILALKQTRAFLIELARSNDASIRDEAARLLRHYPDDNQIDLIHLTAEAYVRSKIQN